MLTARGSALAPACTALIAALDALQIEQLGLNKWSMPVVAALDGGERRFGQLRRQLPEVSPRSLTLALKALAEAGLVERRVLDAFPPATLYRLAPRASAVRPRRDGWPQPDLLKSVGLPPVGSNTGGRPVPRRAAETERQTARRDPPEIL